MHEFQCNVNIFDFFSIQENLTWLWAFWVWSPYFKALFGMGFKTRVRPSLLQIADDKDLFCLYCMLLPSIFDAIGRRKNRDLSGVQEIDRIGCGCNVESIQFHHCNQWTLTTQSPSLIKVLTGAISNSVEMANYCNVTNQSNHLRIHHNSCSSDPLYKRLLPILPNYITTRGTRAGGWRSRSVLLHMASSVGSLKFLDLFLQGTDSDYTLVDSDVPGSKVVLHWPHCTSTMPAMAFQYHSERRWRTSSRPILTTA